jgi:hypothetical protein
MTMRKLLHRALTVASPCLAAVGAGQALAGLFAHDVARPNALQTWAPVSYWAPDAWAITLGLLALALAWGAWQWRAKM